MTEKPNLAWCYRFRFDSGEVFYIGNTTNPFQRIKAHKYNWLIAERFHVDLMRVPFAERFKIETALIRRHRPSGNNFVARYDNQFKDIEEEWLLFASVFPNGNLGFGHIEYYVR